MKNAIEKLCQKGMLWAAEPASNEAQGSFTSMLQSREGKDSFALTFNLPEIDSALPQGGLRSGKIHEWLFSTLPPYIMVTHLLRNGLRTTPSRQIIWIGKKSWPSPFLLQEFGGEIELLKQSLFIDPQNKADLFWCIDTALRSDAAPIVIAFLTKIPFTISRRFVLAAERSNALGILMRPEAERSSNSAAATRWHISETLSTSHEPVWRVELLNSKGGKARESFWFLTQYTRIEGGSHEEISLRLSSELGDKSEREEEQSGGKTAKPRDTTHPHKRRSAAG